MSPPIDHSQVTTLTSNTTTTNDHQQQHLFLCFTSRLSSTPSMKITNSILNRRLKPTNSLKGAQSPMFPPTSSRKKTGPGFDNPEPSSPKVTCIGQVRVKSKKKKTLNHQSHHHTHHVSSNNNLRSRSQRRSVDYSFRRVDGEEGLKRQSSISLESTQRQRRNTQKWVHMPVTLCDSLRSFGSDFNCFTPCRSPERERREADRHGCGSVLARWLVPVQEGEGGQRRRQIELVVGGGREDGELCGRRSYRKRHVLEDIDINEIEKDVKGNEIVYGGRVSICIPPKNALLLMRCGSDPVKMAALANRFWKPPEKEDGEEEVVNADEAEEKVIHEIVLEDADSKCLQAAAMFVTESDEQVTCDLVDSEPLESNSSDLDMQCDDDTFVNEEMYEDASEAKLSSIDIDIAQAVTELEDNAMEIPIDHRVVDEEALKEFSEEEDICEEEEEGMTRMLLEEEDEAVQMVTSPLSQNEECDHDTISIDQCTLDSIKVVCGDEMINEDNVDSCSAHKENSPLPDCLLLMMCEPKLSMEVSQETWVCTRDFIRWLPPRELNDTTKKKNDSIAAADELLSKRVSVHYKPPTAPRSKALDKPTPPRSSCSYPAPPAKQGDPLLYNLKRCKSEPRRAAAKLAAASGAGAENCFWKNRAHAPVGLGAAGVGC